MGKPCGEKLACVEHRGGPSAPSPGAGGPCAEAKRGRKVFQAEKMAIAEA